MGLRHESCQCPLRLLSWRRWLLFVRLRCIRQGPNMAQHGPTIPESASSILITLRMMWYDVYVTVRIPDFSRFQPFKNPSPRESTVQQAALQSQAMTKERRRRSSSIFMLNSAGNRFASNLSLNRLIPLPWHLLSHIFFASHELLIFVKHSLASNDACKLKLDDFSPETLDIFQATLNCAKMCQLKHTNTHVDFFISLLLLFSLLFAQVRSEKPRSQALGYHRWRWCFLRSLAFWRTGILWFDLLFDDVCFMLQSSTD